MAEEMPYPATNVPIAMVGSVVVNGIIGLSWALMLLFSLGDLDSLLETATGFPFMQLFLNVMESQAGATVIIFTFSMTAVVANAAGLLRRLERIGRLQGTQRRRFRSTSPTSIPG